ncbi:hypothetical protein FACS18945_3530 [Bacteroidia bacterium]|nr:hypothetical protein FACS18945_3530 [Bacteroidia bacterium]
MKILFIARHKPHVLETVGRFVSDQIAALQKEGIEVALLPIKGNGLLAYFKYISELNKYLKHNKIDIMHAHNGFTGFIVNFCRKKPVVVTYHGSDINNTQTRFFSRMSILLSTVNIFISDNIRKKANVKTNYSIIPCGVDTELFKIYSKEEARKYFAWSLDEKIILFAGNFQNKVKNYPLAQSVIEKLPYKIRFVELKGFLRNEVGLLMNAVDMVLLTSLSEGSPQFIKEAMACNCPIVATNVGDISERIENVTHSYVTSFNRDEIKEKIMLVLEQNYVRTNGREEIFKQKMDSKNTAKKIINVYSKLLNK